MTFLGLIAKALTTEALAPTLDHMERDLVAEPLHFKISKLKQYQLTLFMRLQLSVLLASLK